MKKTFFYQSFQWFEKLQDLSEEERNREVQALEKKEPELAKELRGLFAALPEADAMFAPWETDEEGEPDRLLGTVIGDYRMEAVIGEGGMGTVYRVVREGEGFTKTFAMKVLTRARFSAKMQKRFLLERQILARLEHPNIAQFLDGGFTKEGCPFLVMEYVPGHDLKTYDQDRQLDVLTKLNLFLQACDAVGFAHGQFIIHCDLKPANILVTQNRTVKLVDFGIARLTNHQDSQGLTSPFLRVFTPEYASPEQFLGEQLTQATDVYSLGAVLYEWLTGHQAFNLDKTSLAESEHLVVTRSVPKPSSRVRDRPALARRLRGDLDRILLKCLQKEPSQRYISVAELGADIRRYLQHEPVLASPPTFGYILTKFLRRNRLAVATVLLLLATLVTGLVATSFQAKRAEAALVLSQKEADRARQVSQFLIHIFQQGNPQVSGSDKVTVDDLLAGAARRFEADLDTLPEVRAELHAVMGKIYYELAKYDEAIDQLDHYMVLMPAGAGSNRDNRSIRSTRIEALIHSGQYDDARRAIAQFADLHEANEDPFTLGLIANNRGFLAQREGDRDQAMSYFEEALTHLESLADDEVQQTLVAIHNNIGNHHLEANDFELAQGSFEAALAKVANNEAVKVVLLSNLAVVYLQRKQLDRAVEANLEVIKLKEALFSEDAPRMGTSYQNLAQVYMVKRDFVKAAETFDKAKDYYDHQPENFYQAFPRVGMANALMHQEKNLEALAMAEEGLAIMAKYQPPTSHIIGTVESLIGKCQIKLGRTEQGVTTLLQAYEKMKPLGANHPNVVQIGNELAQVSMDGLSSQIGLRLKEFLDARAQP